jgi:hypothetical protein
MTIDHERSINAAGGLPSAAMSGYGASVRWPNVGERVSHS